jgi:Zn-finger nucleic acid-binding protein
MNCPTCQATDLRIADRQGIEIDCCPQCRGVWLDRGELDKIIERSASSQPYREVEDAPPGTESAMTMITMANIMGEGESAAPSWMTCLTSAEAISF